MSSFYNIYNWYWKVLDSSPGTQVFSSASGGFVLLSDPTYTAWLAADGGNQPTEIPTLAGLYEGVFNSFNERLARPSYAAMTIGVDTTLTNPLPTYLKVTPTADNLKVIFPQSNKPGSLAKGQTVRILNGATVLTRPFTVYAADGTTQIWGPTAGQKTITGGEDVLFTQTANDSVNGSLVPQGYLGATVPVAVQGVPTNTARAAGIVGEYLEHSVGTGVALTTGIWTQIATITLTPGDWDVWGVLQYDGGGTTTVSAMQGSIKNATASPDFTQGRYSAVSLPSAGTILPFLPTLLLPATQWLIASNTTIFLNTSATFGVAGMNAKGRLMARRRS